jgi:hypothetical protein
LTVEPLSAIAPTHFGIYRDAAEHLRQARGQLAKVSDWMEGATRDSPGFELFRSRFESWREEAGRSADKRLGHSGNQQLVNPAYMSAQGLYRYWQKALSGMGSQPS